METNKLYELAEKNGITVDDFSLPQTKSISFMDDDGDCYIAIDKNISSDQMEEKIRLAHELGHCMQGAFHNRFSGCDSRSRHERRAWVWTIKKLIPKDELIMAVNSGYGELWQLAEYFNCPQWFVSMAVEYYQDK